MGWIGRASAALALAAVCLAAGSSSVVAQTASGQCRAACNTNYTACQKRAINGDTCLRRWIACKKKCEGRATPPPAAPATK
ncbi:MAG: hypothetical protein K1X35_10295 [Caulobacteraceae bacterium]|nr:hypothetical protein [Caulobacteraceae bacterium]